MGPPPASDPSSQAPTGTLDDTDELAATVAHAEPGASVSRYVVLERIGMGGVGVVYAAYDPELDRKVAIKLLQAVSVGDERASMGGARLLREAQALARLTHPNVVTVHDVGTWDGRVFIAMEFVRGRTLSRWIAATSPTPRAKVEMFVQAGRGLAAAHAEGLVHRDFKPENVIVGDDGRARVLDFGLARTIGKPIVPAPDEEPHEDDLRRSSPRLDTRLTRTGVLAGTPAYMSPEQFQGLPGEATTDQFSFCVALWEALFRERPFAGQDRLSIGMAVVSGTKRPMPVEPRIPAAWRRVLQRGLAVEPAERFPSMDALLAELHVAPSRLPWIAGATLAAVGVGGIVVATREEPPPSPCAEPQQHIASAWNRSRREALLAAFAGSGSAIGKDTGARVVTSLDGYASDWTAAWQEACVATHERHERSAELFDRAMTCLQHRRDALAATTTQLEQIDAATVVRAVDAVASLPQVARCADHDALLAAFAPPDDAATAEQVAELRREAADAEVLGRLGRYDEGLVAVEAIRARASTLGYAPLVAELDLLAGDLARFAGRNEDGRRRLVDAVVEALAVGHDAVLATAATKLAGEIGIGQSRYDEGLLWARQAAAAVQRIGRGGPEDEALAETMCQILADRGDVAVALAQCTRAVELAAALWGEDDLHNAGARQALGIAYFTAGRYADAEGEFVRVRDAFVEHKGEHHPDVLQVRNSLAATCHAVRGAAPCVDAFGEVVTAAEHVHGPEHPEVAGYANNYAIVLHELGRDTEAEANARRALAIRRKHFGEDHPGVGAALGVLGQIAMARGDLPAARAALDDALANLKRTRGARHPDVVEALRGAGEIRIAQGEGKDGVRMLEEALALATELGRPASELDALRAAVDRAR